MTEVQDVKLRRAESDVAWQRQIARSRWRHRAILILPVVGVVLLVFYASGPYRLCFRIVHDVQTQNARELGRDVDFESIRSAFKTRMTECFTRDQSLKTNPFGGLALALINPMIDNLLTPETLLGMISGSLNTAGARDKPDPWKIAGAVKWESLSTVTIGNVVAEGSWLSWRVTSVGEIPCPAK